MSLSHKMNSTVVEVGDTQRSQEEQFKQRLIWAMLAMKSQDVSEDIMWKNLNREFFRDCKNLVKCMQQSVQSKLKSMLQVNDVREHLSKENQMSAVDWLLFDTIMVDEGIDVLHFEDLEAKCLEDLFELVKEYKVEGLEGETLAKAWIRITLQYNKGGRECSPMLLQLRWYQLKKFARCRIYRKPYPGQNHHQKLLTAIAITYQKIITIPFAEWKTFVKKRLVILPKEFLKIIKQEPELKHVDPCEIWYLPKEKKIQLITENTIEKTRRGNVPFIITNVMSKAAESNKGRNLTHVATAVNCANDTEIIICDSDDEFNDLLRDKANNLTELSLKTSECIPKNTSKQKKRVFNKININKFSSNSIPSVPKVSDELITLDSDDEMDKILQEKANLIRKNSFSNIKDKITIEKETAKEKNHYEGGEEEDFENENIEFVDDGIEFIEDVNKNQKNGSKIASVSCRNTSETDESSEFDLKLLMNVTVYTKKLNHMEVFKFIDFNEVKDKRVIDRATLESKPRDKHAPKTEDIERLREEAIPSKETKGTQERSDMRSKHIINKVKCTSWLFQKPRKRTYDMTQLSKNPDFNHRLQPKKNLSLRSLELVKECFPITVDLHREFENKLVDGTVYLDSGKFKSAKTVAGAGELENKCNNLRIPSISVRKPSELLQAYVRKATLTDFIPIPDTINKIPNTMKLIPDTINQIPDSDENDVCKISNSSFVQLTKIESHPRRKVINLPHIAEIRATNQSLHVAEIPPTHQNEQIISNLREENRGMAKKIHVNASNVANTKKLDYLAVSIDNVAMRKANNTTPKISPAVPSNSANTSGPLRKDSNKSFVNSMIKRIQPRKNSVQTNVITVQSKPKQLITKSSVNIEKPLVVPECAKSSLKVQNSSNITLKQNTKNISQSSNISEDTKFILLPDGIKFVQLPGNELAVSIEPTASIQPKDFSVIMDICASSNAANKPKIITQQHPNNIIPKLVPFNTNEQQQSVLKKCIVKRRLPTKNIKCIKPSVERDRGKVQIVLNATKPYDTKVQDIIGVTGDMGKRVTTEVRPVVNKIGISADTCINREFSVSSSSVAAGACGITSDMSIATASLAQNIYLVPSASNTDGLSNVTGVLTPVTVTNGFRINVESVNPELCPLTNVPTYNTLGSSEVIGLSNITNKVGNKNIANPKSYTLQSGMEINTRTDSVYQEMWNVVIEGEKESNTDLKILGS